MEIEIIEIWEEDAERAVMVVEEEAKEGAEVTEGEEEEVLDGTYHSFCILHQ